MVKSPGNAVIICIPKLIPVAYMLWYPELDHAASQEPYQLLINDDHDVNCTWCVELFIRKARLPTTVNAIVYPFKSERSRRTQVDKLPIRELWRGFYVRPFLMLGEAACCSGFRLLTCR